MASFGDAVAADQRLRQPVGVVDVVEAEAALDAEPVLVGRAVAAVDVEDPVVLDVHRGLAADAAIGAERVDASCPRRRRACCVALSSRFASISAPVGQTCTHSPQATQVDCAHGLVEVEHDLGAVAAIGHADDVVRSAPRGRRARTGRS